MAVTRRFSHSGQYQQSVDTDGLVLALQRLARHRAFDREQIASPALKKFLPANGTTHDTHLFRFIKDRVEGAKLDAAMVVYLTKSAEAELGVAYAQRV